MLSLTTCLILLLPVLPWAAAQKYSKCGKNLQNGLEGFDFEEFASKPWQYYSTPKSSLYKDVDSADLSVAKGSDGLYISTVSIIKNDGSKLKLQFQEKYLGDASVFETKLDESGQPTASTYSINIYAYNERFAQFTICSYDGVIGLADSAFVLVRPGLRLNDDDKALIAANNKKADLTVYSYILSRKYQLVIN